MISHYQRQILERMQSGERLCKHYRSGEVQYCFANGDPVKTEDAQLLFNGGIIRGAEDGLFGDTQTYEVNFIPED